MKISKRAIAFVTIIQLVLLSSCNIFQSWTDLKTSTIPPVSSDINKPVSDIAEILDVSSSTGSTSVQSDTSFEASKNTEDKAMNYLFDIYSEKDDIDEAVKEISLKYIDKIKNSYNKRYIEQGFEQRMDDARMIEESGYNNYISEYDNIVEGGTLYIYYLVYELKPRYPNEFPSGTAWEILQENGWLLYDGVDLIIYHENNKKHTPFCFVQGVLFDEFLMGKSTEEVLAEIVKNKIPQLKLLNNSNISN